MIIILSKWLNWSIWLFDGTLTSITTPVQSGPGSKGNEILDIPRSSRIDSYTRLSYTRLYTVSYTPKRLTFFVSEYALDSSRSVNLSKNYWTGILRLFIIFANLFKRKKLSVAAIIIITNYHHQQNLYFGLYDRNMTLSKCLCRV